MEVARGGGAGAGKLNPWAEPFVPAGWSATYRRCGGVAVEAAEAVAVAVAVAEVEDFSPEWWRLVAASPAFRDRWLRDYSALGLLDDKDDDLDGFLLPDDLFSTPHLGEADEKESKGGEVGFGGGKKGRAVVSGGSTSWTRGSTSGRSRRRRRSDCWRRTATTATSGPSSPATSPAAPTTPSRTTGTSSAPAAPANAPGSSPGPPPPPPSRRTPMPASLTSAAACRRRPRAPAAARSASASVAAPACRC